MSKVITKKLSQLFIIILYYYPYYVYIVYIIHIFNNILTIIELNPTYY